MKENITVKAQVRESGGSSASRRIRRAGDFPAVVYGKGGAGFSIQVNGHSFEQMLGRHHSEHMMLDLEIEGRETSRVLLKSVQHHPITGSVIHADFQSVALDELLRVEIPLELTGEPVGVSRDGGVLEHLLRTVEVECLPGDLLEDIPVDVSGLEIGQHLSVGVIQLDSSRYRMVTGLDIAIATVSAPRVEEEKAAGSEVAGTAEPELVKVSGDHEDKEND